MSDIADKIYAATGLTLGAEAAAAIERLIQAENEKLRAENEHLATSNHAYLSGYQEAIAEIEKLRAAIKMALECLEDVDVIGASLTLTKALGEKE